jgi:uncharacterized protein with LGFP repeats
VQNGANEVGRYSRFDGRTHGVGAISDARIYWSPSTGAWEVYRAFLQSWLQGGGPIGALGFPTSGELSTTGGGRFHDFQGGLIVWHSAGPYAGAFPVRELRLELYRYEVNDDFNVCPRVASTRRGVRNSSRP